MTDQPTKLQFDWKDASRKFWPQAKAILGLSDTLTEDQKKAMGERVHALLGVTSMKELDPANMSDILDTLREKLAFESKPPETLDSLKARVARLEQDKLALEQDLKDARTLAKPGASGNGLPESSVVAFTNLLVNGIPVNVTARDGATKEGIVNVVSVLLQAVAEIESGVKKRADDGKPASFGIILANETVSMRIGDITANLVGLKQGYASNGNGNGHKTPAASNGSASSNTAAPPANTPPPAGNQLPDNPVGDSGKAKFKRITIGKTKKLQIKAEIKCYEFTKPITMAYEVAGKLAHLEKQDGGKITDADLYEGNEIDCIGYLEWKRSPDGQYINVTKIYQ